MIAPTTTRKLASAVLLALCFALLVPAAGLAAPEYTEETRQALERQLAKGEVSSAEFNKQVRSVHIKLQNGQLYLYHYEKGGSKKLKEKLVAKHVTVTVHHPNANKHKLRYIAIGVAVLLVVIAGVAFYYWRRRRNQRD